jgi:hypothetical protein
MSIDEEAYIYVSSTSLYSESRTRMDDTQSDSALRLAVAHGYHCRPKGRHVMQWEKVHTNRLWWTIYMQERYVVGS